MAWFASSQVIFLYHMQEKPRDPLDENQQAVRYALQGLGEDTCGVIIMTDMFKEKQVTKVTTADIWVCQNLDQLKAVDKSATQKVDIRIAHEVPPVIMRAWDNDEVKDKSPTSLLLELLNFMEEYDQEQVEDKKFQSTWKG